MNKINYVFEKSKTGETVPLFKLQEGNQSLHSMIDPKKEAQRLISGICGEDFIIFLGLGGGFAAEAALESANARVLVIDFDKDSITQLFANISYAKLTKNKHFTLLVDPDEQEIKNFLIENFKPALYKSLKTIPLRTRIEKDKENFDKTITAIQEAIEIITADYSVQAHFGKRWFSNIIRNIKYIKTNNQQPDKKINALENTAGGGVLNPSARIKEAAIVAAGPSLDCQIKTLAELKSKGAFIISTDTALGALSHNGIEPDAVVSIDCQHISYYHFIGNKLKNIPLILDIASPPLLAGLFQSPLFFCGGHPLAKYFSGCCKKLQSLDTSGGNVTYTCLCLAESLNAEHITLFGADFSYVDNKTYARGTYLNSFFSKKQNRFYPLESQETAFLYRSPFLPREEEANQRYRETSSLRFYRKKLEEKSSMMKAVVISAPGFGAPIRLIKNDKYEINNEELEIGNGEWDSKNSEGFLKNYREDILKLPEARQKEFYFDVLNEKQKVIYTTLLPYIAFYKKRNPELKQNELIENVKRKCAEEIARVLKR